MSTPPAIRELVKIIPPTTRWETYAQAGARLGISAQAVRAHAKRNWWPRQRPNDNPHGPVLVAIPENFRPQRIHGRAESDGLKLALEQADKRVAIAEAQVVTAEAHRQAAEARIEKAEARADRAEALAAQAAEEAEKGREAARVANDAAQAAARAAAEALAEADKLREAEAARKARGRLARLRAAWRGE